MAPNVLRRATRLVVPALAALLRGARDQAPGRERGQAAVLLLGVVATLVLGALILGAFGQALGAKGRHQRAADLAAMSAVLAMREAYPRLFEAPKISPGVPEACGLLSWRATGSREPVAHRLNRGPPFLIS